MVAALLAWSVLAFGGVYRWAAIPVVLASGLLTFARPPVVLGPRDVRLLDLGLLLMLAGGLLQLVPLPAALTGLLSPNAARIVDQVFLRPPDAGPTAYQALSIQPASTAYWLALLAGFTLLFWTARTAFGYAGLRFVLRTIAALGLGIAMLAIAQHATSQGVIYWFWEPREASALVFGPFVNRNHFATWVLLAVPLCAGYLLARRRPGTGHPQRAAVAIVRSLDPVTVLLTAAVAVMTVALFISASRTGVISLLAAATAGGLAGWSRAGPAGRRWTIVYAVVLLVLVIRYSDVDALLERFEHVHGTGGIERVRIWRDTRLMIGDFWLTGTGLGTFATAMPIYQRHDPQMLYNHAHNHYLHMAAEGGLLLGLPAILALAGLGRLAARRLREDRSGVYWIRLGASTALVAVVLQSLGETGLRAPANAVLFAIVAAIAVHRPRHRQGATGA